MTPFATPTTMIRYPAAVAALLLGTAIPACADPASADVCRKAIEAVKAQPGYTARYNARIRKSGSDPFEQVGTAVRRGDLFYREGRREGEKLPSVRLYRRQGRIAVLDPRTEQWLTGEQAGDPTLGKGLEDPDVALAFLLEALDDATAGAAEPAPGSPGRAYTLAVNRQRLAKKVGEQYEAARDLDWEKAEVKAEVVLGGDPALPRRVRIEGSMPGKDKDAGTVTIGIDVEISAYGPGTIPPPPADAKDILGVK
jgi:hypothetical protein